MKKKQSLQFCISGLTLKCQTVTVHISNVRTILGPRLGPLLSRVTVRRSCAGPVACFVNHFHIFLFRRFVHGIVKHQAAIVSLIFEGRCQHSLEMRYACNLKQSRTSLGRTCCSNSPGFVDDYLAVFADCHLWSGN